MTPRSWRSGTAIRAFDVLRWDVSDLPRRWILHVRVEGVVYLCSERSLGAVQSLLDENGDDAERVRTSSSEEEALAWLSAFA